MKFTLRGKRIPRRKGRRESSPCSCLRASPPLSPGDSRSIGAHVDRTLNFRGESANCGDVIETGKEGDDFEPMKPGEIQEIPKVFAMEIEPRRGWRV